MEMRQKQEVLLHFPELAVYASSDSSIDIPLVKLISIIMIH